MVNVCRADEASLAAQIRVLLVDDASVIVERLAAGLGAIDGLTIVGSSQSSAQAMADIVRLEPNVIILDIHLGDDNGWDVLQYVRRAKLAIRVFVFSNDSSGPIRERFITGGADRFFDKSCDFIILRQALQELTN